MRLDDGATEVITQVAGNFVLDLRLEEQQHEPEACAEVDLTLAKGNAAVHPGALEMNVVAVPAIFDSELSGQVPGQVVRGGLGVLPRHGVARTDIDRGHLAVPGVLGLPSVSAHGWAHQTRRARPRTGAGPS